MNIKRIGKTSAQVITKADGTEVLISYSTPVACWISGEGAKRTDKHHSVTTSKQVNQWLKSRGYTPVDVPTAPQSFFDGLL